MSSFLAEGGINPGASQLTPANAQVSDADVALMQRVLAAAAQRPNMIPDTFMGYVLDYIQANNLTIPISQISGFTGFVAQPADTIITSQTTSATAYTGLGTVGPTISGLADGLYLMIFGAWMKSNTAGNEVYMSVSVNGDTPVDSQAAMTTSGETIPGIAFVVRSLDAGGNNNVTAEYRSRSGTTATFGTRSLVVFRTGNL